MRVFLLFSLILTLVLSDSSLIISHSKFIYTNFIESNSVHYLSIGIYSLNLISDDYLLFLSSFSNTGEPIISYTPLFSENKDLSITSLHNALTLRCSYASNTTTDSKVVDIYKNYVFMAPSNYNYNISSIIHSLSFDIISEGDNTDSEGNYKGFNIVFIISHSINGANIVNSNQEKFQSCNLYLNSFYEQYKFPLSELTLYSKKFNNYFHPSIIPLTADNSKSSLLTLVNYNSCEDNTKKSTPVEPTYLLQVESYLQFVKSVISMAMDPILSTVMDIVGKGFSNHAITEMSHALGDRVPPQVISLTKEPLTRNISNLISDAVSMLTVKKLTKSMTDEMGPFLLENIYDSLIEKLHTSIHKTLTPMMENRIDLNVPELTDRSLFLSLLHSLTNSITYSLTSSLSLAINDVKGLNCYLCYYYDRNCNLCIYSKSALYYNLYHAAYYSNYYVNYYENYYMSSAKMIELLTNPSSPVNV